MENSRIEWTDHTFNPWVGCEKVSAGCKNCYAEHLMDKRWGKVKWGKVGPRKRTSAANWKKPLRWDRNAERTGKPQLVFCASLADVFEDRPELVEWRKDLFSLIGQTPNLRWLLLTKRPENVVSMIVDHAGDIAWLEHAPNNVWIGTSIENQQTADERIPHLVQIPAAKRFLSVEPLLGKVNLGLFGTTPRTWGLGYRTIGDFIHWVIVGGESGSKARPMHPDWVRSIRDQCIDAQIDFFFKQWGAWRPYPSKDGMERIGKKKAGRLLDGRQWDQHPATRAKMRGSGLIEFPNWS